MTHSIGIIGGGAAGMMAAMQAKLAHADVSVTLFDTNPGLGAKVIISGGGRCNVTTGYTDITTMLTNYPRGGRFLKNAMYAYGPSDCYEWFEAQGVPLKTEKDMRVFPVSDDGKDVVKVFEKFFKEAGVEVLCKTKVKHVTKETVDDSEKFIVTDATGGTFTFDRLIITTGGQAYRHTGSTGDGYAFAEALGHTITELGPSLNSFNLEHVWELAGVSHEQVTMRTVLKDGKKVTYSGPFVWTHKGISGPVVFAMSAFSTFETCTKDDPIELFVDFIPTLSQQELEDRVFTYVEGNPKTPLYKVFHEFMPKSVIHALLRKLEVNSEKPCNETKHADIRRAVQEFKNFPLKAVRRGQGSEFVTAGGVDTSEINPKTMESRICPGLYFAGEIMNVDGFTGGYNLHASWAAGRLAGISASEV